MNGLSLTEKNRINVVPFLFICKSQHILFHHEDKFGDKSAISVAMSKGTTCGVLSEMPVCYTQKVVQKTEISHKMLLNLPNWPENV